VRSDGRGRWLGGLSLSHIPSNCKWAVAWAATIYCASNQGNIRGGLSRLPGIIVIRTGPDIEPVRSSVHWFIGPTIKNRLNR